MSGEFIAFPKKWPNELETNQPSGAEPGSRGRRERGLEGEGSPRSSPCLEGRTGREVFRPTGPKNRIAVCQAAFRASL